jgi:peroxiredoxin
VAVNLQESPQTIRAALERLKLATPVVLDQDGAVAGKYAAVAIPQTVIIDRSGKVFRLFVGGGPQYVEQVQEALQKVLSEGDGHGASP